MAINGKDYYGEGSRKPPVSKPSRLVAVTILENHFIQTDEYQAHVHAGTQLELPEKTAQSLIAEGKAVAVGGSQKTATNSAMMPHRNRRPGRHGG